MTLTLTVEVDPGAIAKGVEDLIDEPVETTASVEQWIEDNPGRINELLSDAIMNELAEQALANEAS